MPHMRPEDPAASPARRLRSAVTDVVIAALCAVLGLSFLAHAEETPDGDPADDLRARVAEARTLADYGRAGELARELVDLLESSDESAAYEIATARELLKTVESAATLGPADRLELATSDSLAQAMWATLGAGEYALLRRQAERALAIRERLLGQDHLETADAAEYLGLALSEAEDLEEALALQRRALDTRLRVYDADHPDVAVSHLNIGAVLMKMSKFQAADAALREALDIRRGVFGPDSEEVVTVLGGLASLHTDAGWYESAERLTLEVLEIRRRQADGPSEAVARTLNNLNIIAQRRGDYAAAEDYILEALSIVRKLYGEEHSTVAYCLNNLATLQCRRGNYAEAEALFRETAALRERLDGGENKSVANILHNLATTLKARGDYSGAEPIFRRSLLIRRRLYGDEHPYVAESLGALGALYQSRGDYAAAEALHTEALDMRRRILGEEHPDVSASLQQTAVCRQHRGDYGGAEKLLRESLAISRAVYGEVHPSVASDLNSLARTLQAKGDHAAADSLFRAALAMRRATLGDRHSRVAVSMHNLAGLLRETGEDEEAEELLLGALEIYREQLGGLHPHVCSALVDLGQLHMARGDHAAAEPILAEAAEVYEQARLSAGPGLASATFATSPYPLLAAARLELGMEDSAWTACELGLGRALADMLWVSAGRRLTPSEAASEDSLRLALSDAEKLLEGLERESEADTTGVARDRAADLRLRVAALQAEWSALQTELADRYPVASAQVRSLSSVQAALAEREAVVGWLDVSVGGGEHASWGYVVRRDGPVSWARLPDGALGQGGGPYGARDAYRRELRDPSSTEIGLRRAARAMWAERIEPVLPFLEGVERLVVVPSSAVAGLPLEVLEGSDGAVLGERFSVSYSPSSSVYAMLSERAEAAGTRSLLVGDPPYNEHQLAAMESDPLGGEMYAAAETGAVDEWVLRSALRADREALASLPRLPGSRVEIEELRRVMPEPTALLGPDASEKRFLTFAETGELADFVTLHVATHALMDDERPDDSALVMAQTDLPDALEAATTGGRIYDGLVSAKEIAREWTLDADLVTLSACETGLGKSVTGEGHVGFAHALFQAGARSVLASLWKVEDTATALLMRRFYENRLGGRGGEGARGTGAPMGKAEALREAKLWLRNYTDERGGHPYRHPYFWSAFVLIGDR